jgi:hypothetical protein
VERGGSGRAVVLSEAGSGGLRDVLEVDRTPPGLTDSLALLKQPVESKIRRVRSSLEVRLARARRLNKARPSGKPTTTETDEQRAPPDGAKRDDEPSHSKVLRWVIAFGAAAAAISSIIALGGRLASWWDSPPSLELVSVRAWDPDVLRHGAQVSAGALDITLENGGDRVVALGEMRIQVKKTVLLYAVGGTGISFSCRYEVELPGLADLSDPKTYSIPISQEVPANDTDRFLITIGDPGLVGGGFVSYAALLRLEIPYDDGEVIRSPWILMTVGAGADSAPHDVVGQLREINATLHPVLSPGIASALHVEQAAVIAAPDTVPACI